MSSGYGAAGTPTFWNWPRHVRSEPAGRHDAARENGLCEAAGTNKKKPPVRQAAPRASVSLVEASSCLDSHLISSSPCGSPSSRQRTQPPFAQSRVVATLGPPSSGGFDRDQRLLRRPTEFQILGKLPPLRRPTRWNTFRESTEGMTNAIESANHIGNALPLWGLGRHPSSFGIRNKFVFGILRPEVPVFPRGYPHKPYVCERRWVPRNDIR